ncbi:hypothetical protein [Sulfobacillus thermosulfidooxidans]|uniref:hypothetical protein n=1 Tax=Sulfobacillus thermosulfidooxidans TaxID=28034 RepID=UPI001FA908B2|nr:hypothetical protein [Sulfobacillus thermosulfidooxidans]
MTTRFLRTFGMIFSGTVLAGCGTAVQLSAPPSPHHSQSSFRSQSASSVASPSHTPSTYNSRRGVNSSTSSSATTATPSPSPGPIHQSLPPFSGTITQRVVGSQGPQAVPNGFVSSPPSHVVFSPSHFTLVESFTGLLKTHPFVLDFYQNSAGLFVGINYNHHPVFFGPGPAPVFNVLNFTGSWVVLGTPSAAAYEAINLTSGRTIVNPEQAALLKGYTGLGLPSHILGLSHEEFPVSIPSS